MATEAALGGKPGSFMQAYRQSRDEGTDTALEAEPIVYALFKFAKNFDDSAPWTGPTKDLLDSLNREETDDAVKRSAEWPKTPKGLSERLKRLAPPLVEKGVNVERIAGSRRDGRRLAVFFRQPPEPPGRAGDGIGDDTDTTVTDTVTNESPKDKPNTGNGDGGDRGDGSETPSNHDEEWGEE
jgi:hypothetical protein